MEPKHRIGMHRHQSSMSQMLCEMSQQRNDTCVQFNKANHMSLPTFLPDFQDTVRNRSTKNLTRSVGPQANATDRSLWLTIIRVQCSIRKDQNWSLMSSATKVFGRPEHNRSFKTPKALTWDSSRGTFKGELWPHSRRSARARRPALPQTCESLQGASLQHKTKKRHQSLCTSKSRANMQAVRKHWKIVEVTHQHDTKVTSSCLEEGADVQKVVHTRRGPKR